MSQPRLRRCANRGEFERTVDDLAVQGYKIKSRSDDTASLHKPEYGSVGIHVILFLVTVGIGNVIYAAVKYSGRDQVTVRIEEGAATT